jgi:hypothetical protein
MSDLDIATLPEPLKAAFAEFEAWVQGELLADQARSIPQSPLYHYTDQTALHGVLEKQQLWCFLHIDQSDPAEVRYSMEIARHVIREEASRGSPPVESLLTGLDGLLRSNPLGETFDFYFFSLSSHRDDPGQWEEYGRKGTGFAIGFAPTLFRPDQTELLPRATENMFVSRVIYGRDATRTRHRRGVRKMAEIVGRIAHTHRELVRGQNLQTWFDAMNKLFIADLLIWNCLTAKADRYRHEQETRYIILGVRDIFNDWRRSLGKRSYVETPLPLTVQGNLIEVLVGPLAVAGAEEDARDFLRSHGYSDSIPVTRSSVST